MNTSTEPEYPYGKTLYEYAANFAPLMAAPSGVVGCYILKSKGQIVAQSVYPPFACAILDLVNGCKPKPLKFSINDLTPLETYKEDQWFEWEVNAEMSDGTERMGTCQGGCENSDTFEASTWGEYEA
jgi:hypothetical protein